MRGKVESKVNTLLKIHVESTAPITDFQYNHNGTQLAVCDSDGYVFIYQRNNEHFNRTASFRADEAAVWKITWADPAFGDAIAIGTFKRKVAIFQLRTGTWTQIAYHELHEGSVNHVEWASSDYGCKLFSAGSDGSVAILELKKNTWVSSSFFAHECSVTSMSVRPVSLSQVGEERSGYPLIATAAKDNAIKVWRHTSQIPEEQLQENARIYQQVTTFKTHKQSIRAILWKQRWSENSSIEAQLFSCSEDGTVKLTKFINYEIKQTILVCEFDSPVFRLAQSMTGNLITVAVGGQQEHSYVYQEGEDWHRWNCLEQLQ